MSEERVVLCMKWGDLYPGSYVNVLYHAVQDHLKLPHRFVCLTNEPDGLADGIEHFPIPDLGIDEAHWYHGAWPKLAAFQAELYGLTGRCLFIDLDSFICGDLSVFFENSDDLTVIDTSGNWVNPDLDDPPLAGSGVFTFTLGALGHLVDHFMADREGAYAQDNIEQVFLQRQMPQMAFWPQEWVLSFKKHLRQPPILDRILPPKAPPASARIIAFHGEPRPLALIDPSYDHGTAPRAIKHPVGWARAYWERYSG